MRIEHLLHKVLTETTFGIADHVVITLDPSSRYILEVLIVTCLSYPSILGSLLYS